MKDNYQDNEMKFKSRNKYEINKVLSKQENISLLQNIYHTFVYDHYNPERFEINFKDTLYYMIDFEIFNNNILSDYN